MVIYTRETLNQISFKDKEFRLILVVVKNMREILSMVYSMVMEFKLMLMAANMKEIL
jgi:hypothetical protein